jgi:transposase
MIDYRISKEELAELRAAHREARAAHDVRRAYRINAVILLGQGRTVADVADALLFDPDTVRDYFKRYKNGGVDELLRMSYVGSEAMLNATQLRELDAHLQDHLYDTADAVARYVEQRWGVHYSASGMTAVLHRLGYVHKKAKLEPGKHPPPEVQEEFVEKYENLKENKAEDDVICFMDATHPLHNPVIGRGWIKRGKEHPIQSNTGRRRLNINGAINIETMSAQVRFDDTIDAESTIALFKQLEEAYPSAKRIIVICDNARYYKSQLAGEYLKSSPIELLPLPPYCPNLNLIERFWKFFKRKILYNQYYETFGLFTKACKDFFANLGQYVPELRKLLAENFQIIGDAEPKTYIG